MTNVPFIECPHGGPIDVPAAAEGDMAALTSEAAFTTPLCIAQALAAKGLNSGLSFYQGSTMKSGVKAVTKSVNVASGVATFYLTDTGLLTGAAIFTDVFMESINLSISDAAAAYQMAYSLSGDKKTLTVTVNKLTTSNILTGILGQAAAPNGTVVRLLIFGN